MDQNASRQSDLAPQTATSTSIAAQGKPLADAGADAGVDTHAEASAANFDTLFEMLPLGAYRSTPNGRQVRANAALVRLNGYETEAQLLASLRNLDTDWYVLPTRRREFREALERDGHVRNFVSEMVRHRTQERLWISENAHLVRDENGRALYYEGTVDDITDRVRHDEALHRSEAHFRHIANQVPGVVFRRHFSAQAEAHYSFVSDGVRAIYGVDPQEAMRQPDSLRRFRHPNDMQRVDIAIAHAVAHQLPLSVAFRVLLDDGSPKWLHMSSSPTVSETNEQVRVGLITDVSAQYAARAALQESEERWKLALDITGDGVWDWNIQTGTKVLSQRGRQMYGLEDEGWDDHADTLDQLTHPDDLAQMLSDRQAHFDGSTAQYANEHRIKCRDGRWKWVLSRGMIIARDEHNHPLRMIGTHTDITARKEAEALRQARDRAEAAQQAMTSFLSRVSHELRTPLNAILGFSQLIDTDPLTPHHQGLWVKNLLSSGRHLLALVEDILDLSGVQSGHMSMLTSDVNVTEVLQECMAMLAATADAGNVTLHSEITELTCAPLRTDRKRLKQVLSNLLSNAIKYNRPGGAVHVRLLEDGSQLSLIVQDTGKGLSAEQLARLFTPFDRLGAQFSDIAGAGLGLALSRQLAQAMGGDIVATSEVGVGSCFTLHLPRQAASADLTTAAQT